MADTLIYDEDLIAAAEADTDTYTAEEFDQDADYAAPPPPLPDGWYEVELTNLGAKDPSGKLQAFTGPRPWGNVPKTYFTQISGKVMDGDPAQIGKLTARYNITTHPDARQNNTSSAALLYKAIGEGKPLSMSPGQAIVQVVQAFQGQSPRVWVRTQLEGQAQEAGKAYNTRKKAGMLNPGEKAPKTYRGQKHFTDASGKLTGKVMDEESGEIVVAQPAIVDIKPLSFVPPSR